MMRGPIPSLTRRRVIAGAAATVLAPATARAGTRGIILVGAAWCPYCHRASDALYLATRQWGWSVLIASVDERQIGPFEYFVSAAGHPIAAQIQRFPTTLVVDPTGSQIVDAFEGFRSMPRYLARLRKALAAQGGNSYG